MIFIFGLLSSSLLLFAQGFGRYVLGPSSGVCRTRESTRNFELRPLLNPRWSPVLITLTITLRRQLSGGCRFNPDCKQVTIQEFLKLLPENLDPPNRLQQPTTATTNNEQPFLYSIPLTGTTTSSLSRPESKVNEGVPVGMNRINKIEINL